jgi:hypothetical protein
MNAIVNETLEVQGVLLCKIFGRQKLHQDKYETAVAELRDLTVKDNMTDTLFYTMVGIVVACTYQSNLSSLFRSGSALRMISIQSLISIYSRYGAYLLGRWLFGDQRFDLHRNNCRVDFIPRHDLRTVQRTCQR